MFILLLVFLLNTIKLSKNNGTRKPEDIRCRFVTLLITNARQFSAAIAPNLLLPTYLSL